jgi:hypothetical protein
MSLSSSFRLSVCGALVLGCFAAAAFWLHARSQSGSQSNAATPIAPRGVLAIGALYVISIILIPALTRFPVGLLSWEEDIWGPLNAIYGGSKKQV